MKHSNEEIMHGFDDIAHGWWKRCDDRLRSLRVKLPFVAPHSSIVASDADWKCRGVFTQFEDAGLAHNSIHRFIESTSRACQAVIL